MIGSPVCKIYQLPSTISSTSNTIPNPFTQSETISTIIEVRCVYTTDKIAVVNSDQQLGAAYQKVFYIYVDDLKGKKIDSSYIIEYKDTRYKIKSINNLYDIVLEVYVE